MTTYNIYSGQFDGGVTLEAGDVMKIFFGGSASGTVDLDGREYVEQGGVSEAETLGAVNGGTTDFGTEYVLSGGIDEGATIVAGDMFVASGALVQGLTVSGGFAEVDLAPGAMLQDATFLGGGEVVTGANLSGYELDGSDLASLTLISSLASNTVVGSGGTPGRRGRRRRVGG